MSEESLKDQLSTAMKAAMRAREKERLGTIRLIQAAIKQIEVDERIEVDDARVLQILDKMAKQRRESIDQYANANRQDLVDKEQAELEIIQEFLPAALSDAEIDQAITDALAESGASSMQEMGKVMALLKPKLQGRADMSAVSAKIKEKLG